jgi:hypothetical protein
MMLHLPSGRIFSFLLRWTNIPGVAFEQLLGKGEDFFSEHMNCFPDRGHGRKTFISHGRGTYGHHIISEIGAGVHVNYIETKKIAPLPQYIGEYLEGSTPFLLRLKFMKIPLGAVPMIERWRSNCGCNAGTCRMASDMRALYAKCLDWLRMPWKQL